MKEKTNPSYKQLLKMAEAVGGDLFVTPMKNMTVLVPYDLQESVRKMSADAGKTTNEYLESVLRNAIDDVNAKVAEGVSENTREIAKNLIKLGDSDEKIASATGLSLEDVIVLRSQLEA
ncbi:MAG: hypothetical protein IKP03_10985 [Fibrobacter sp.]|nr:hypothetical protein [Fibrobacter sp.]